MASSYSGVPDKKGLLLLILIFCIFFIIIWEIFKYIFGILSYNIITSLGYRKIEGFKENCDLN